MKPRDLGAAIVRAKAPVAGLPRGVQSGGITYGVVQSIQIGVPTTLTITLAGSSTNVAGVAYLSPYSPVAGDTVAILQAGHELLVLGSLGIPVTKAYARVYRNASQTLSNGTNVAYDTTDRDPLGSISQLNTSGARFTAKIAGVYRVTQQILMQSTANLVGSFQAILLKTGGSSVVMGADIEEGAGSAGTTIFPCVSGTADIALAVNDYVQIQFGIVNANVASLPTVTGGLADTWMNVQWAGPL